MALIKGISQIVLLCIFSIVMNKLVDFLHIRIPGSILGVILLFALLQSKIIRLEWIEVGGKWLLTELLLFFIPSAVGIMKYKNMLMDNGIYILLVIILSTLLVMACTGILANIIAERKGEKGI